MKKQPVLVSVTGWTRDDDDQPGSVRLLTTGILSGAKGNWRIDYTETQPDNDTHDVTLTLDKGVVSMVFQQGRRFEGSYQTPYGALAMGVYPTHVRYRVDDQLTGEVDLTYQLDLQGQFAAMHELRIKFCPSGTAS